MEQDHGWNYEKLKKKLCVTANMIIRILGAGIFLALLFYAFRYSQYMHPNSAEIPINFRDSMKKNLFVTALVCLTFGAAFLGATKLIEKGAAKVLLHIERIIAVFAVIWITGCSLWWVSAIDHVPVADQAFIYGGASYFLEGSFSFLDKGGYCEMYPHQLPLIALLEVFFLMVGTYNYFAVQIVFAIMAGGIVWVGYLITKTITENSVTSILYSVLMMCCMPLVFYTSWVYGEIPSIFFSLLTAWMLLKYQKTTRWIYLVGSVLALTVAILVRKNTIILLVAFCLAAVVYALVNKDKKMIVAAIIAVILPCLSYSLVYKMYEVRSGYEHTEGLPTISWIAMGMQENRNGTYGWYNNYPKQVYYDQGADLEKTKEIVKQDIADRLDVFASDGTYTWTFFREKVLSQWNVPMYQSLYFNLQNIEVGEKEMMLVSKLQNDYFYKLLFFCDRLQFIVYLGTLFYYIFAVRKNSNVLQHLIAISVIGGFLFSIIWEAKARYTFPYYILLFPIASVGYYQVISKVNYLIDKFKKKEDTDNIIPFRKAA